MGFLEDLVDGITGETFETRASDPFSAAMEAASDPGRLYQQSLDLSSLFSVVGDVDDVSMAFTGKSTIDPDHNPASWERWASLIGLGAFGAVAAGGAAMAMKGMPPSELLYAGKNRIDWHSDRGALQIAPGTPSDSIKGVRGGRRFTMNQDQITAKAMVRLADSQTFGLDDPDRVFMTTSQLTNDLLRVDIDEMDGYPNGYLHLARTAMEVAPVQQELKVWDDHLVAATRSEAAGELYHVTAAEAQERIAHLEHEVFLKDTTHMEGFLQRLGSQLQQEVPSLQEQHARVMGGEKLDGDPKLGAAAWATARWMFAHHWSTKPGGTGFKFQGDNAENALVEWNKLLSGSADVDMDMLSQSMTDFMKATEWITHPELVINPLVAVSHVNLDKPGTPTMGLSVLEFSNVPLEMLTGIEVSNRLKALAAHHPSGMVGLFTDNLKQLMDSALNTKGLPWNDQWTDLRYMPEGLSSPNPKVAVAAWRKWYKQALKDLEGEALSLFESVSESGGSRHWVTQEGSTRWMISTASILSAGEDWSTNVPKAALVGKFLGENPNLPIGEAHEALLALGVKLSDDDLVRIRLLDGVDDPLDLFRTGEVQAGKGLNLKELKVRLDNGEDPVLLAPQRQRPQDWQSIKTDAFAYAIAHGRDADAEDRMEYLSRMMAGDDGWDVLSGERGAGENLRRRLPVVADRQHYKASIGFSLIPSTWYASQRHAYDQFAQAARIVAAELGKVDGVQVLPEEVQAITWMRYRAMSHHTDPLGRDFPAKRVARQSRLPEPRQNPDGTPKLDKDGNPVKTPGIRAIDDPAANLGTEGPLGDPLTPERRALVEGKLAGTEGEFDTVPVLAGDKNPQLGQTVGWRKKIEGNTAGFTDGHGPDLMFSNSVMRWIDGSQSSGLPSQIHAADAGTDMTLYRADPKTLGQQIEGKVSNVRHEVTLEIALDGTVKVLGDGVDPMRGRYATLAEHNGKVVLGQSSPRSVDDNNLELDRIQAATRLTSDPNRKTGIGAKVFVAGTELPWNQPGPKAFITSMLGDNEFGPFGGSAADSHARTSAILREHGIEHEIRDLPAHEGVSSVWEKVDPETKEIIAGPFWNSEDAEKALGKDWADFGRKNEAGEAEFDTENRQGRVFIFKSVEDLHRARKLLAGDTSQLPAVRAAQGYMEKMHPGKIFRTPRTNFYDTPELQAQFNDRAARGAAVLDEAPSFDPAALPSYDWMWRDVKAQFLYLRDEIGLQMETVKIDYGLRDAQDPYPSTSAMIKDIRENNRLVVAETPAGQHPLLELDPETGWTNNDMFRAVHDYFGHAVHENDFTRWGEDVAFLTHSQMFHPEALPALAADLRMQNWWVISNNPEGAKNAKFPEQKVFVAPKEGYSDVTDDAFWRKNGEYDRLIDKLMRDQVPDIGWYVDSSVDAPPGTIPAWEHVTQDRVGRVMSVLNSAGSPHRSNSAQVWLEPGSGHLGGYVTPARSGRFDPGGVGDHSLAETPTGYVFDGKIEVLKTGPDQTFGTNSKAKGKRDIFDVAVDGEAPSMVAMWSPAPGELGMPVIAFGDEGLALLISKYGPDRVVDLEKGKALAKNSAGKTVERGAILVGGVRYDGQIDPVLLQKIREVLVETSTVPKGGLLVVPKELRYTKPKKGSEPEYEEEIIE